MSHPSGGYGRNFKPVHTFDQAYVYVGEGKVTFTSTTGERMTVRRGMTKDGKTPTLVFTGQNSQHGNVCHACWGYRSNCTETRIGHCTEALDRHIP